MSVESSELVADLAQVKAALIAALDHAAFYRDEAERLAGELAACKAGASTPIREVSPSHA